MAQENRGGYRPGAGRKPDKLGTLSAAAVAKMLRKARRASKKHGKDVDDVLLSFVYDVDARVADRLAAIRLWKEYTAPKLTEGSDGDKALGPAVFLPEHRPQFGVIEGGKAA